MKTEMITLNTITIAELISDAVEIHHVDDALNLLGNCGYQGASGIIIHDKHLVPGFFDLKTGLAGDILQKFSNYNMKLAIVGNFSKYTSKSLTDFMYESNASGRINFVSSVAEARDKLTRAFIS